VSWNFPLPCPQQERARFDFQMSGRLGCCEPFIHFAFQDGAQSRFERFLQKYEGVKLGP
jgi:hypothetical protein